MAEAHPDIESILLSEEEIKEIVARMGKEITRDYADKNPLVIAVLRGAVVFMADVMRAITCPMSSGVVRIVKDLDTKIEGRNVLIVEDILDSGLTLSYLMRMLQSRNPASIEIAAFVVKDIEGKKPAVEPRYVGAHVPNAFVVGYGLDYAERYRNLPYLGVLKPSVYE